MSYITPAQLAHQRRITAPTFTDTCQRLVHTAASGDYGYGTPTYPAGSSSPCLFIERPLEEAQGATMVEMADGKLYLPLTFTLLPDDRVMITHMNDEEVVGPKTYAIVKGPIIDDALLYAELELVTDGSDA